MSYDEALNEAGIPIIISYWENICDKVFNAAVGNKDNKLNKLLTEANKAPYLPINHRHFEHFYFVIMPKVQLNGSVLMHLYIIYINF